MKPIRKGNRPAPNTLAAIAGETDAHEHDEVEAEEDESRLVVDVSYRPAGSPVALSGVVVMRAPSASDEARIGRAKARLTSGLPIVSFDGEIQELFGALAVCQVVIEESPPWFKKLDLDRVHADLYVGLFREWAAFSARYFRERTGEGAEEAAEPACSIRPRLRGGDGTQG